MCFSQFFFFIFQAIDFSLWFVSDLSYEKGVRFKSTNDSMWAAFTNTVKTELAKYLYGIPFWVSILNKYEVLRNEWPLKNDWIGLHIWVSRKGARCTKVSYSEFHSLALFDQF